MVHHLAFYCQNKVFYRIEVASQENRCVLFRLQYV